MSEKKCLLCFQNLQKKQSFYDWLYQSSILCGSCKAELRCLGLHVHIETMPLCILYEYNDFLENMLFQYKEAHDVALARVFFHEHSKQLHDKFRHYTIVLLPSSEDKLRERNFHAVKAMLSASKLTCIEPFYKNANYKQSSQSFKNRGYISKVIQMKEGYELPKTKLLLVDDVCTSGSTLKHAYHLLLHHTYKIEALVLSATPLFVESCGEKHLKKGARLSILERVVKMIRKVKLT